MLPRTTSLLLLAAAAVTLIVHVAHDLTGFGSAAFDEAFAAWCQPVVFLACGFVTLARVWRIPDERAPWLLFGSGLTIYGFGSVYFNLSFGDDPSPPFPSLADGMWLALYPLTFAAIGLLVRRRYRHMTAAIWLDALIGGTVVGAVAAAVVFEPIFDVTVAAGAASAAHIAYPLGDLGSVGFVVVVWSLSGRRLEPFWALLGTGFGLLALADSVYVVQAAHGDWAPGGPLDLPYFLGTMLFAAAAWSARPAVRVTEGKLHASPLLLGAFAVVAVVVTVLAVLREVNPLASGLALVTLVAVVARFGSALSSLTRQQAALAARASTDALTGLANHRAFHERLAEELARSRRTGAPLSVATFDIDHFKAINDTFGHSEGDAALQAIAGALEANARPYDVAGRIGGEEFALILRDADGEAAWAIADRCRLAVAELRAGDRPLSCSAGVAAYPADDPSGQRLLEFADGALYWAKRAGRAQVRRFDPREVVLLSGGEQHGQVRALLDADGALTPVFQPIVELATGRIAGYEALTRVLAEPLRSPDLWLAQARRCGLGAALEARAIELALAVPGRPPGAFLSINVSPAALLSADVERVLPPDLTELVVELTEDDLFTTDAALDRKLEELRARGARIAIDDAGAGYAGLQQLVRVKPDILKLDRSLISAIHADGSKIALLEAMTRFATTTGAAVCAEGIEAVQELQVLGRFDVTYGQGYALGHPAAPWPGIDEAAAAEVTAEARWGMRLLTRAATDGLTVGDITDALARARTLDDLNAAIRLVEHLMHADEVMVSIVAPGKDAVETLSDHSWTATGERFEFADYPTTERVIVDQILGQVIEGDPAADPNELEALGRDGFYTVLLAPVLFRGETVGLLEIFRRAPQPWVAAEADVARMLGHHLGATLSALDDGDPAALPPVSAALSR